MFSVRCALLRSIIALGFVLLVACEPSPPSGPRTDSNTNWLSACATSEDCAVGEACLCGACSVPCADDSTCARQGGGRCASEGDDAWADWCANDQNAPIKLCLQDCEDDSGCAADSTCMDGVCGPSSSTPRVFLCVDDREPGSPDAGGGSDDALSDAGDLPESDTGAPEVVAGVCDPENATVCGPAVGQGALSVFRCTESGYVFDDLCPTACVYVDGAVDRCDSGAGCVEGTGTYCGEALDLPPGHLFFCSDDGIFAVTPCVAGCQIVPGGPDRCIAP